MFKKNSFYVFICLIGLIFVVASLVVQQKTELYAVAGVLIGIGSGAFGAGLAGIIKNFRFKKNPDLKEKISIELEDERNIAIINSAKAKAGNLKKWVIFALAMITVILKMPLWLTLVLVAIVNKL